MLQIRQKHIALRPYKELSCWEAHLNRHDNFGWGGVIGMPARQSSVDQGTVTQPGFSFWFKDGGWQMENYGTEPDSKSKFCPKIASGGKNT